MQTRKSLEDLADKLDIRIVRSRAYGYGMVRFAKKRYGIRVQERLGERLFPWLERCRGNHGKQKTSVENRRTYRQTHPRWNTMERRRNAL